MASRRSGRAALRDPPSSPSDSHISVNVNTSKSARASGRRSERFEGGQIVTGTRNRGGRKNYVIESSDDDDDDGDARVEDDDMDDDDDDDGGDDDEDAEGEEMEVDAEGDDMDVEADDDAEGDDAEGDVAPAAPTIRVSQPSSGRPAARAAAYKIAAERADDEEDEDEEEEEDDDVDDEELSDPGESDAADQRLGIADETMADEDAEGEEIEVLGEDEPELVPEPVSDVDGSQDDSPDLTKMTKRQRARFEEPQEYMKLSDEVQVKKHFTAEELSMRRQEMARRRRNLSEKRTEEVKMETINKLLKKQAPKLNRKAAAAASSAAAASGTTALGVATPDEDEPRPDPLFIRWVNKKSGSVISVPGELLSGPAGSVFVGGGGLTSGKMVEEVT
ncbi:PAPA-1-like conserved region family protein [Ophiocordyceps camponoti-floridani]|uniref:PAPA-1-like conserved region family protein n=1 Tax=Ophiocordyceps camponoti-floridani TaxID=2030778 RepID=A0A8H4Q6K7_9HYPO|nr:PAPA-1-like conserved region family protein [Ophiocordyceps camponoti-floridani]